MEKRTIITRPIVITLFILMAAMSRLVPHPPNFAPIGAMALLGAAYYSRRLWAFVVPVAAMWISDLVINNVVYGQYFDHFVWFYSGAGFTYASFIIIALLGMVILRKVNVGNLIGASLGASTIFFLVSNFGVWATNSMYAPNLSGLGACYLAGIPFFKNTIAGDVFYVAILFGAFEWSAKLLPQLRKNVV